MILSQWQQGGWTQILLQSEVSQQEKNKYCTLTHIYGIYKNGTDEPIQFMLVNVSCSVISDSLQSHRLQPARLLCPQDFPGKNTGVDCHSLLQRIFPTQGSNLGLLHCRHFLYHLRYREVLDEPIYMVQIEMQTQRTHLWTQWGKVRVVQIERVALKHIHYHV